MENCEQSYKTGYILARLEKTNQTKTTGNYIVVQQQKRDKLVTLSQNWKEKIQTKTTYEQ